MKCKICKEAHTPIAMYSDGQCIFCKVKLDAFVYEGMKISRVADRTKAEQIAKRKK